MIGATPNDNPSVRINQNTHDRFLVAVEKEESVIVQSSRRWKLITVFIVDSIFPLFPAPPLGILPPDFGGAPPGGDYEAL